MKIHLNTTDGSDIPFRSIREEGHKFTLVSFAYKNLVPFYESAFRTDGQSEIILDSGAFTAWNAGKPVVLENYAEWAIDFRERNSQFLEKIRCVNLDVIPGSKGNSATPEQLRTAAIDSANNARVLRDAGISISEVFHQDESFDLLEEIVERAEGTLICLSPRNDVSIQSREQWLKHVCGWCHNRYGLSAMPRAHGLAVTSERLLYSYPFYSADSSSWAVVLRFGQEQSLSKKLPRAGCRGYESGNMFALKQAIARYQRLENLATKLWQRRGIVWDD